MQPGFNLTTPLIMLPETWLYAIMRQRVLLQKGLVIACIFATLYSIWFDVQLSVPRPMDLRNRVIGARIMSDGASPYFFIWKPGENLRYYDIKIPPGAVVSRSTATPFFHWIMSPVAEMPQYRINLLWMMLEYLMLASMVWLIIWGMRPPPLIRYLLIATAIAFTYTIGWRDHVFAGQNYLFIPFFAIAAFVLLMRSFRQPWYSLLFGVAAVSMVLTRPTTILLLLPLLFYVKQLWRPGLAFAACLIAYILFAFVSPLHHLNWSEYFAAVKVHTANHQMLTNPLSHVDYDPMPVKQFEGISLDFAAENNSTAWLEPRKYNGNFFNLYYAVFKQQVSIPMMTALGLLMSLAMLVPLFWFRVKGLKAAVPALFLIAFSAYAAYEYFTPVTRSIYGFTQWLLPLLILWLMPFSKAYRVPVFIIAVGVAMHIIRIPLFNFGHVAGQMLTLAGFLWLGYASLWQQKRASQLLHAKV